MAQAYLDQEITYAQKVGPKKAELLEKEWGVETFRDMLYTIPFRYEDRSTFLPINKIHSGLKAAQVKAKVKSIREMGQGRKRRLSVVIFDETGYMELVWFKGVTWIKKQIKKGEEYIFYGRPSSFRRKVNMSHPEISNADAQSSEGGRMEGVYNTTQAMKKAYLESKALRKIMRHILEKGKDRIPENLPHEILQKENFMPRYEALYQVHFPENPEQLEEALRRLKFEELFFMQVRLLQVRGLRRAENPGLKLSKLDRVNHFIKDLLPFDLTGAQKRVLKEIREDLLSGAQMNRLLQGDVGSGKTIVAFISMLMAIDNGFQTCLIAPTEVLAQQHFKSLLPFAKQMNLDIRLLTGSTKQSVRSELFPKMAAGQVPIVVGTHALLEEKVKFHGLGLCVIDEQHRFGVAQRAKLWEKNPGAIRPHILIMTATPIPRTLAMTMHGDLHVSVIDELPAGRKPVRTVHRYENRRVQVYDFVKEEIAKGRQAFFVYPLIEESESLPYRDVEAGLEMARQHFPEDQYEIVVVTGAMPSEDKDAGMKRFAEGKAQIMIATTVIEVGINVPNASLMLVESAEKFGLSQLHQLRGRVGRGAEQSYCILMTDYKLSANARTRLETMVRSNDGFEIAEVDLQLRGPGDILGTQQSGKLEMHFADLARDTQVVEKARHYAYEILKEDINLSADQYKNAREELHYYETMTHQWNEIS